MSVVPRCLNGKLKGMRNAIKSTHCGHIRFTSFATLQGKISVVGCCKRCFKSAIESAMVNIATVIMVFCVFWYETSSKYVLTLNIASSFYCFSGQTRQVRFDFRFFYSLLVEKISWLWLVRSRCRNAQRVMRAMIIGLFFRRFAYWLGRHFRQRIQLLKKIWANWKL